MFQRYLLALAAAVKVEGVITNACCRPYQSKATQRTMFFHEYVLDHNLTYVEKFVESPLCGFKVGEAVSFFCEGKTFSDRTDLCIVRKSMRTITNPSTPAQSTPTLPQSPTTAVYKVAPQSNRQPLCDAEATQDCEKTTPDDTREQPTPPQSELSAEQQIRLSAIQLVKDGYLIPTLQGTKVESVKGLIEEWVTAASVLAEYITTGQQPPQPAEEPLQQLHAFPYEQRQVVMPEIAEPAAESTNASTQATPTEEVTTISAPASSSRVTVTAATSVAEQP